MLYRVYLSMIMCVGVLYHAVAVVLAVVICAFAVMTTITGQRRFPLPWSSATMEIITGAYVSILVAWWIVLLWALHRRRNNRDKDRRATRELDAITYAVTLSIPVVGIRPLFRVVASAWKRDGDNGAR